MHQEFRSLERSLPGKPEPAGVAAGAAAVEDVSLSVHCDPAAVESAWRGLEPHSVTSIYQRFDWVETWCRQAAPTIGVTPALVVGSRRGRPLFLLPLGTRSRRLGRVAEWLGGSHVNNGMGVFDRAFAASLDRATARRLFHHVLVALAPVDVVALRNQPFAWQGVDNPLRHLAGRVEDQPVLAIPLQASFEAMIAGQDGARRRKKMRWQENTLAPVGGYRFFKAETHEEADGLFGAFLRQKAVQFAQSGIDNVFAEAGAEPFFRDLIRGAIDRRDPLIELYGLEIDGEIRATFAAGAHDGRVQGYFNGINLDQYQRVSPGELLLYNLVRDSCRRGLGMVDLGVGDERYKASWHAVAERQFATFLPATLRGRAAAALMMGALSVGMRVRRSDAAWAVVKKMRRWVAGRR